MALFNFFLRRASSSMMLRREIVVANVENSSCGRLKFPRSVRFLTGFVDKIAPTPKEVTEETLPSSNNGLPFVVKDDSPSRNQLTLLRKCKDEIIQVHATLYQNVMDLYDDRCSMHFHDFVDDYVHDDHDLRDWSGEKKLENPDQIVDVNPCLYLLVKIYYGYMYRKHMEFRAVAFADCPDKLFIRHMSARVIHYDDDEEEQLRQLHLDDFEDVLNIRGIPRQLNNLFHDEQKINKISEEGDMS